MKSQLEEQEDEHLAVNIADLNKTPIHYKASLKNKYSHGAVWRFVFEDKNEDNILQLSSFTDIEILLGGFIYQKKNT